MKSVAADQLSQATPCCRGLLNPVTRKTVDEIKVLQFWVPTDDSILVQGVEIIQPCPGAFNPQALEGWDALSEDRPYLMSEEIMVSVDVSAGPLREIRKRNRIDCHPANR